MVDKLSPRTQLLFHTLQGRKGFSWWWDGIDADIQNEIIAALNAGGSSFESGSEPCTEAMCPCPFCGGTEILSCWDDGLYWKRCAKCGATGPETTKYDGEEGDPYLEWNTRFTK